MPTDVRAQEFDRFALPYSARLDRAFQDTIKVAIPVSTTPPIFVVGGSVYIIPQSIRITLGTDATVSNRFLTLTIQATWLSGTVSMQEIPPSASLAASLTGFYFWLASVNVAYSASNRFIMPLPQAVFMPGTRIQFTNVGGSINDLFQDCYIQGLFIPSGPAEGEAEQPYILPVDVAA